MSSITAAGVGRPQDADVTEKILAETLRQLRAVGYAELRIERIAAAVGCGKASIYRRWETKAALTADAIKWNTKIGEVPDTGNIVDDLVDHAWQNVQNQAGAKGDSPGHSLWESIIQPEVRVLFWGDVLFQRRQMGRSIIERSVARGELPVGTDADAILDALAGLTLYRHAVRAVTINKEDLRPVVLALTTAPPLITK